jgi:hypothetical protein
VALFCQQEIFLGAIWCDWVRLGANAAFLLRHGDGFCGGTRSAECKVQNAEWLFLAIKKVF